jgi:hypothetical protein
MSWLTGVRGFRFVFVWGFHFVFSVVWGFHFALFVFGA